MILSDVSVKRPVFAAVISLMLLAFGGLSFLELPLREYPDINPPLVSVETTYPGASADIVESRVTQVIEGEISGIQGIKTISSRSRDGSSSINIEFELDRDIDIAANDIRDRVSRSVRNLPEDIDPPRVQKQDSEARPIMWLSLVGGEHESSLQLTDYAERYLVDRFSSIPGVSQVTIGGNRPSMRIWVDRTALAARNLTVGDIQNALSRENLELPAGRIDSQTREFPIRLARNYQTADDFRQLVIAEGENGHLIRLGEITQVELAPEQLRRVFRNNGSETVSLGIVKQSTANTVEVLDQVKQTVVAMQRELPPSMRLSTSSDDSAFILAAINAVYSTIGYTTLLVGLVIFIFLGSLRSTLIPLVTIPVCLIASFIVIAAFGYSVNLITLLALVLSIGLVVDDSIVVLENVHRRIEEGEPPLVAAFKGARQVAFAVIATTAVVVAVFAPIVFLQDNAGVIFAELAVTICAAVIFSSVLALSLTPMMCSKLLRADAKESRASVAIDRGFRRISAGYQTLLRKSLQVPLLAVWTTVFFGVLIYVLLQTVPREYAPQEDQGTFITNIIGPEGMSFEAMAAEVPAIEAPVLPYIEEEAIMRFSLFVPRWGNNASNSGVAVINLPEQDQRLYSTPELMQALDEAWSEIPGIRISSFMRSGISRSGGGQPVQFVLLGTNYEELAAWRDVVITEAEKHPAFARVDSDLKETQPQLLVRIDKDRAAVLGVSVRTIGSTLQIMMSEQQASTYVVDGEEYRVIIQAKDDQRATPQDLRNIYVRSDRSGQLIPLANLIRIEDTAGIADLNRYNRLRSVTITADLNEGYALGEALAFLERVVDERLPPVASYDYKGQSLEFKESSGSLYVTLLIAIVVLYLVMAAQFESFVHPFVILFTVPFAVAGALVGLMVTDQTLNIYSQIGILMLVGIASKNGILIVEFINQLRDQGMEFSEAILEAARIRFRPVMMTTISTLMGAVPLIIATGPGSESRTTLGIVVFFGVAFAAFLTLFIIPAYYKLLARNTKSPNMVADKLKQLMPQAAER